MYRNLMKDFEKIQKTVKDTSEDESVVNRRRTRSFDLKQTSSWYFDFQSIESKAGGDRGGGTDDDSSLSSNMSLLSSASLDKQRKFYASKRKQRNRFVDNPKEWDQAPIVTTPLDLKVVAHHQNPAKRRSKSTKDAPGKQPKGIDPPGKRKTNGVGIAPQTSRSSSKLNAKRSTKGPKQGRLRRALSSPGSIFGGQKSCKGDATKPGSFQAAVSPPQKTKRDAPGETSSATPLAATGLAAQIQIQQQLVSLRSHLGEYQEHDALSATTRTFDRPMMPVAISPPPEQTIKHVYSAEDESWDADDDNENDYNVRRRRRAQPAGPDFGDDYSIGTADDHSLLNLIVGGETPAFSAPQVGSETPALTAQPESSVKSIPVLPPTFAQQLVECDKEAAAAAAAKKRKDENAEPNIDLESVKHQAQMRLRSARNKANSTEEESPKLKAPPSVGHMTTEEFLRLAAENASEEDEVEEQLDTAEEEYGGLEGRRLEFGEDNDVAEDERESSDSSAAVRNGREQAALAHADVVSKEVNELLARFKSDTGQEAVAAATVPTQ